MKRVLAFLRSLFGGKTSSAVVFHLKEGRLVISRDKDITSFFLSQGGVRLGPIRFPGDTEIIYVAGAGQPSETARGLGAICGAWSPCEGGFQRRICSRPTGSTWEEIRECIPGSGAAYG